jgi:hypothetical protein
VVWRGSAAALALVAACSSRSGLKADGATDRPAPDVSEATDAADASTVADAAATDAAALADRGHGDARDAARPPPPPAWSCQADGGALQPDAFPSFARSCAALPSCGGDPTGQWAAGVDVVGIAACPGIMTGACAVADPAPGDPCSGLDSLLMPSGFNPPFPTALTVRGATLKLPPSGDFTLDIDVTGPVFAHFAPSCVKTASLSCTDLFPQVENAVGPVNGLVCVPSTDKGCDCSWTYGGADPAIIEEVGTWRAEGNLLHLNAVAPDGGVQAFDYTFCVNGGALSLTAAHGSPAFGPTTMPASAHRFGVETLQLQRGQGTVLHWNGTTWSVTTLGDDLPSLAVGGSGPADVWAVGSFPGGSGAIGHWNGVSWSEEEVLPPGQNPVKSVAVQSVWASARDDVWAAGTAADGPALLHWNGAAWSRASFDVPGIVLDPTYSSFGGFWGSGSNDVWLGLVSSLKPTVLHFDGTKWEATKVVDMNTFGLSPPMGLSGTGPSDIWAILPGQAAQIVHWDGSAWSVRFLGSGTFQPLATWDSGPNDVWAVGAPGTTDNFVVGTGYVKGPVSNMIHWDGQVWSAAANVTGTPTSLSAIWGSGPDDIWAVGSGTIMHWNGQSWSVVVNGTMGVLEGIWGSGPDDVWAVMK